MKLLSKTTLLIATVSVFIFLIGNITFFYITKQMIKKHIDNELITQMHEVMELLNKDNPYPIFFPEEIVIKELAQDKKVTPLFSDTVLYNNIQQKYIPYRSLKFSRKIDNSNLLVIVHKSLLSSDKLVERITMLSLSMLIVFIVMIYIMNRFVFANVWSDFFDSLKRIEKYDIKKAGDVALSSSEIEEFEKLNDVLNTLVHRIQNDYKNLKELTANTSHEIQTPLAIIKNKAEVLLQSPNLDEKELTELFSIIQTVERLSKLNQALLLITKIENNQFEDAEIIDVNKVLEKHLGAFEMLFESGDKKLKTEFTSAKVKIHPVLLDVLITNLLKNALVHGQEGGNIYVVLKDQTLSVKNEGEPLPFNRDDLFKRFVKTTSNSKNSGLGLEIVNKICKYYGMPLAYAYDVNIHCFSIDFTPIVEF